MRKNNVRKTKRKNLSKRNQRKNLSKMNQRKNLSKRNLSKMNRRKNLSKRNRCKNRLYGGANAAEVAAQAKRRGVEIGAVMRENQAAASTMTRKGTGRAGALFAAAGDKKTEGRGPPGDPGVQARINAYIANLVPKLSGPTVLQEVITELQTNNNKLMYYYIRQGFNLGPNDDYKDAPTSIALKNFVDGFITWLQTYSAKAVAPSGMADKRFSKEAAKYYTEWVATDGNQALRSVMKNLSFNPDLLKFLAVLTDHNREKNAFISAYETDQVSANDLKALAELIRQIGRNKNIYIDGTSVVQAIAEPAKPVALPPQMDSPSVTGDVLEEDVVSLDQVVPLAAGLVVSKRWAPDTGPVHRRGFPIYKQNGEIADGTALGEAALSSYIIIECVTPPVYMAGDTFDYTVKARTYQITLPDDLAEGEHYEVILSSPSIALPTTSTSFPISPPSSPNTPGLDDLSSLTGRVDAIEGILRGQGLMSS